MNIVFVVEDPTEAPALKNELAKLVQAAKADASPDAPNLPVDLRHVTVERAGILQDGRIQLPDNGLFPGDIVILDTTLTGDRTQNAIEDAKKRVSDVPVIILTDPKDDLPTADILGAGAADSIAKTEDYLTRLVAIIERESRYQALKREKLETISREKRIRLIIENLPAGVAVIAPDGTILAVNFAGLRLLGFERLEQAVGKNALHFAKGEDLERLQDLLEEVGKGESVSANLDWEAPDGTIFCVRMDAAPMQKQGIQGSAVLAAIHARKDEDENPEMQEILQESEQKLQELEEDYALEKTRWEDAIRHEESLRRETEEKQAEVQTDLKEAQSQLSSLKSALDDSEENRDRLVKLLNTERSKWNRVYQDHEAELRKVEEQRAAFEAKIKESEESRRTESEDVQKERSGWEEMRRQLEQQIKDLEGKQSEVQIALQEASGQLSSIEAALRESEANRTRQTEEHESARSGWEQSRLTLEQKAQEAEEHRTSLESAKQAAEDRNAELETRLREAEEEREALQAKIRASEELQAHRPDEEQLRAGLEQKLSETEEQKSDLQSALQNSEEAKTSLETALKESEEERIRQTEEFETERAKWEEIRLVLEQKAREAEEHRTSLESAKQAAENRNAELEKKLHDAQEARTGLERRFEEANGERAALRARIEKSDGMRQTEAEDLRKELSDLEELRLSLEQKVRDIEDQKESLASARQAAEDRNAELEKKLHDAQETRAGLETRLRETEENRSRTDETLNEERSRWEQLRRQQEQEIHGLQEKQKEVQTTLQEAGNQLSAVEAALRESEENRMRQTEEFETERAKWQEARLILEQKAHEAEEHRADLDSAKQGAEERIADLEARLKDEQEVRTALETRLLEAEESHRKADEVLTEERSKSEQVRRQLEQKIGELRDKQAEMQSALQEAGNQLSGMEAARRESEESRIRQAEEFETGRAKWEETRLSMEKEAHEARAQIESLESARQAAEEGSSDLEAKLQDMQGTRAQLETGLKEADEERSALRTKIEELEEIRRAEVEELRGELSKWEQMNIALEQKVRAGEDQQTSLQSALKTSEEGRSALEAALQQVEEEQKNLLAQHEEEADRMQQEWQSRLQQSEEQHAAHLQNILKNEEERYRRLYDDHQAGKSYIKEMQQQTADLKADLERLQSELLETKNRYQTISEVPGLGVTVTTLEGRVLECNDAAAHMFGYSDSRDALSPAEGKEVFHIYPFREALGTKLQQEGRLENVEWSLLNSEGRLYRFRENVKLTHDSSGELALMERVFADITEEHTLSEEIRRMRKADPSGDAFASAVKILKNLNESLVRCGRDLRSAAEDPKTIRTIAETLESDAGRSSKYINQLIAASSKADRISTVVDLKEILEENEEVLRNLAGDAIDLKIECMPGGSLVAADRGEMVQMILNAAVNSLKSLHLGGSISVRTENVEMDTGAPAEDRGENRSGLYVELTVSADGCEMTPDRMPAFNLAIVSRTGGWSESSDDPQSGHVHKIYLPRVVAVSGQKPSPKGIIKVRLADGTSKKSS